MGNILNSANATVAQVESANANISASAETVNRSALEIANQTVQVNQNAMEVANQTAQVNQNAAETANNTTAVNQNTAEIMNQSAAFQSSITSIQNLATTADTSTSSISNLATSASSAATSLSGLGAAVSSAISSIQIAGANAAASVSTGKVANNYSGGIYTGGAFLSWINEKGSEAIIPLDGSNRALQLWQKTGEILGVEEPQNNFAGNIFVKGNRQQATGNSFLTLPNFSDIFHQIQSKVGEQIEVIFRLFNSEHNYVGSDVFAGGKISSGGVINRSADRIYTIFNGNGGSNIGNIFSDINIDKKFSDIFTNIKTQFQNIFAQVLNPVTEIFGKVQETFNKITAPVTDIFTNIKTQVQNIFAQVTKLPPSVEGAIKNVNISDVIFGSGGNIAPDFAPKSGRLERLVGNFNVTDIFFNLLRSIGISGGGNNFNSNILETNIFKKIKLPDLGGMTTTFPTLNTAEGTFPTLNLPTGTFPNLQTSTVENQRGGDNFYLTVNVTTNGSLDTAEIRRNFEEEFNEFISERKRRRLDW